MIKGVDSPCIIQEANGICLQTLMSITSLKFYSFVIYDSTSLILFTTDTGIQQVYEFNGGCLSVGPAHSRISTQLRTQPAFSVVPLGENGLTILPLKSDSSYLPFLYV